ncbi:MAG: hypothetical protein AAGD28_24935 [Bacteroidota bacterium]
MKKSVIILLLLLFVSSSFQLHAQDKVVPGKQIAIEHSFPNSQVDGFLLYLPQSYENRTKAYPLLMFLQGSAAVGGPVSGIAMGEIPMMLKEETDMSSRLNQILLDSFIVVCPHIRDGQYYEEEEVLREIISELKDTYRVDDRRIYLTGLSRGGMGSWGLAESMSDIFAAVAPMAGGVWMVENFSSMKALSFWVAHANEDPSLAFPPIEEAVEKLEALGADKFFRMNTAKTFSTEYLKHKNIFTIFERDIHNVWDDVYTSTQFYTWLLRQRKNAD